MVDGIVVLREERETANARVSFALAALLLAFSLTLMACTSSEDGTSPPLGEGESVALSLELPSRASAGEMVPLKLIVRNVSSRPLELALGGQEADGFACSKEFVVALPAGTEVWRWSLRWSLEATGCATILSLRTLAPGEELVLVGEWDQRDNRGRTVSAGTYVVRGVLREGDPPEVQTLETEPATLTISP